MDLSSLLVAGARVAVVGSRDFPCPSLVESFVVDLPEGVCVVSGAGGVVDLTAAEAARMSGLALEEFPAAWGRYGRGAGMVRNRELVSSGLSVMVAFVCNPDRPSPGSKDVIGRARKAGVPVFIFGPAGIPSPSQLQLF